MRYFTLLLFLTSTISMAQDSLITEALKQHQYTIQLENGTLTGPGAEWLNDIAKNTQFVLIGEDHGIAQLPQFTAALYNQFYSEGYRYFVTETSAGAVAPLLEMAGDRSLSQFKSYFQQYPMSIAFYGWKEEGEMLQQIYFKNNKDRQTVWAIDQEFMLSPQAHFARMAQTAKNDEAKALANTYAKRSSELLKAAIANKDFFGSMMSKLTAEDYSKLKVTFKRDPQNLAVINGIEKSQQIYSEFARNAYQSNLDRIAFMKKNFLNHYYDAEARDKELPKAIFKFGATHTCRGRSFLDLFDIGNLASELAISNGKESLHILVLGKKGTVNRYMLLNDPASKQSPYDGIRSNRSLGASPVYEAVEGNDWKLVDLRPLRKLAFDRKLKFTDAFKRIAYSYDIVLVIPEVTAASNY